MSDSEELSESEYSESDYSSSDEDAEALAVQLPAPRRPAVPGLTLGGSLGTNGGPAAPPGAAGSSATSRTGVPRLGVPPLGLNVSAAEPADGPQPTARGLAVPSLQLGSRLGQQRQAEQLSLPLASARPHYASGPQAGPSRSAATEDVITDVAVASGADYGGTTVQLVSFAFALPGGAPGHKARGAAAAPSLAAVSDRCVKALGVSSEELRYFELRELPPGTQSIPRECATVGVAVNKSGFSLAAMEALLADNQRLSAAAEKSANALESLQGMVKDQANNVARAHTMAAGREAETRRLQDRVRYLEREVVALSQQLQRSDRLRLQGQQALDELKREFESLMHNILADGAGLDDTTLSESTSVHPASDYQDNSVTGVASAP